MRERLFFCMVCGVLVLCWGCVPGPGNGVAQPDDDDVVGAIGDDDVADDDTADDDVADDDAADDDADDDVADDDTSGPGNAGMVGEEEIPGWIYYKPCEANGTTLADDLDIELPQDITDFCDAGHAILDGDLTVESTRLINLDGLECLCQVNGDITIHSNSYLYDIDGLTNLKYVLGSFTISSDSGMVDADGVDTLRWVGDDFTISNVSALGGPTDGDLAGFDSLRAVGGGFTIETTSSIVHISGFQTLASITEDFSLYNNSVLADVTGFPVLDTVYGDVEITSNPAFPALDAQALADGITTVGGSITVSNNGP